MQNSASPTGGGLASFSAWLLRPYLDLGPLRLGPLHASAIEHGWTAFVGQSYPRFVSQRALPPAFRTQLAKVVGPAYGVTDPLELRSDLRTDRWRELCEAIHQWCSLSSERQCRLASLLHSMCLYGSVLRLIPKGFAPDCTDDHAPELAFWRASAAFMDGLRSSIADYDNADMSAFEQIALTAPDAVPANFNATAMVFVHKAKTRAALPQLVAWYQRLETAIAVTTAGVDAFTADLLTSRFYRAAGFLPQRCGDKAAVVCKMDLAEHHALRMKPTTPAQEILYRENLHALFESRSKEALWLGDKDLALARSLKVIEVDPFDSKAWVEVGEVQYHRKEWRAAAEAYAIAGMLGPPASTVGRHMAGACLRELGQDLLAAIFFKDALELDPHGLSPREEINDSTEAPVLEALKLWSRSTVAW